MGLVDHSVFGTGVYTLSEAARLVGTSGVSLRRWLTGNAASLPLWQSDHRDKGNILELSFRDLIEARVVTLLRKEGVSLQHIRLSLQIAKQRFESDRPFSTGRFRTDGKEIFWEAAKSLKDSDPSLEHLISGQRVFWPIVEKSLRKVEFEDGVARRWWPQDRKKTIVIDPRRSFGQPVINSSGVPTTSILTAFQAEGDIKTVARLFEISPKLVSDAVEFEGRLDN